jgi:DNA processing protein
MDELFYHTPDPTLNDAPRVRELGAYEALWMRERASFRTLARLFRSRAGARLSAFVPEAEADRWGRTALALARDAGIGSFGLLVHGMPEYPARLRDAAHPIELLYFQGDARILSRPGVAIVGTRRPSDAGMRRAQGIATHFARAGFPILSGLAEGIDTLAHRAAIAAGGTTTAVLGTPVTAVYPPGNRDLQRRLARDFLIVSQVPIVRYAHRAAGSSSQFFRDRNATLAALAAGVIVIEAGDRSGALICARHALDRGRRVFIPDSCCRDAALSWPSRLMRRGAVRVRAIGEIDELLAG